jgi:hypothetical protein
MLIKKRRKEEKKKRRKGVKKLVEERSPQVCSCMFVSGR